MEYLHYFSHNYFLWKLSKWPVNTDFCNYFPRDIVTFSSCTIFIITGAYYWSSHLFFDSSHSLYGIYPNRSLANLADDYGIVFFFKTLRLSWTFLAMTDFLFTFTSFLCWLIDGIRKHMYIFETFYLKVFIIVPCTVL